MTEVLPDRPVEVDQTAHELGRLMHAKDILWGWIKLELFDPTRIADHYVRDNYPFKPQPQPDGTQVRLTSEKQDIYRAESFRTAVHLMKNNEKPDFVLDGLELSLSTLILERLVGSEAMRYRARKNELKKIIAAVGLESLDELEAHLDPESINPFIDDTLVYDNYGNKGSDKKTGFDKYMDDIASKDPSTPNIALFAVVNLALLYLSKHTAAGSAIVAPGSARQPQIMRQSELDEQLSSRSRE